MVPAFTIAFNAATMFTFCRIIAANADFAFARRTKTAAAVVANCAIIIFIAFGANGFDRDTMSGAANVIGFNTSDNGALIGTFAFVTQTCFALGILGACLVDAFFT